jgi:hypothetical protein
MQRFEHLGTCFALQVLQNCHVKVRHNNTEKRIVAERGFDPRTSGLWAQHASTAPLCSIDNNIILYNKSNKQHKIDTISLFIKFFFLVCCWTVISIFHFWARICKPFKEPRNLFPAGRAGMTTLFDVPARAGIFKRVWGPGIDSKEWIPPAYVVWRAGTMTPFLPGS